MDTFVARKKMTIHGEVFMPYDPVPMEKLSPQVQGRLVSQRRVMVHDVPEPVAEPTKPRRGRPPKNRE